MARTARKPKAPQVRSVRTKEDRKRPSVFMRLKTDESFKGIALFEPDPELDKNPGYYEYYDHYDKQANQYVPCSGDQCPFCAANDNPSTRALTVWYMPDEEPKDQIKVFTMNYSTISEIADEAEEESGILGKKVRIKRLSDKGDYRVRVLADKPLTATERKKIMAMVTEKFPDGLEDVVQRQLVAQLERLKAIDALEDDDDDDDDDDDTPVKSRRGKAVEEDDDTDEDEDEDEDEEEETDDDEDEEDEEDEDDEEEEEEDEEDEEEDDDEEEEDEEEEDEEEEPVAISRQEYEVVKVQEKDEIFDLKDADGTKVKMWLGEGNDVDYDEVKKGVKVKIDAEQDEEGDWIITGITVPKPKTTRTRSTRKPASTRTRSTRGKK
jgi:hypothetical protein